MNIMFSMPSIPGYEILELLGEGVSSRVYKARQLSTGQLAAIKLLQKRQAENASIHEHLVAGFNLETQLCSQLYHPRIVRLLDKGMTETGDLFAVFEYVSGQTLHELLLRNGPLPPRQAGLLMGQVLDALVAAHELGIVHRDLKPMNIMVSQSGALIQAKLLDFGVGAFTSKLGEQGYDQGPSADVFGTPRYSAPEQLRGEPPTSKSDLYAWGLIVLECLTGSPAITGTTLGQIYHQQLSPAPPPIPSELQRHPLAELLRRVLSKNPLDRDLDARELFRLFHQIDLETISDLLTPRDNPRQEPADFAATRIADYVPAERRQITILCYALDVAPLNSQTMDLQTMEEILNDQLKQCQDANQTFKGYPAGALGNTRMLYFGFPHASENAVRQAARAALALLGQTAKQGERLALQQSLVLQIRIALHTGFVTIRQGLEPYGFATTAALKLTYQAPPNAIIVSEVAQSILGRHFQLTAAADNMQTENLETASTWLLLAEKANETDGASRQLLGRDREFSILRQFWRDTQIRGASLMLVGEPGIGKSHLARKICEYVRTADGCVWTMQCQEEQKNSALHPFLYWLSDQFNLQNQPDQVTASQFFRNSLELLDVDIGEVLPILCSWLSLPIPDDLSPAPHAPSRQRRIILDTFVALLNKLAAGPALIVIEDVHWLDPTSRELVDTLLSENASRHLGLLLTARPESEYQPPLETLHLLPLTTGEAKDLTRRIARSELLSDSEVADLIVRADGNPLYLTELTRSCINHRLQFGKDSQDSELVPEIPASLRDVLSQALDRLGAAKDTAQLAAALGSEFDETTLLNTALRDKTAVQRDLEQMFLADIVQKRLHGPNNRFSFRHMLIRDAAYDSMTHLKRKQTHARIAVTMESGDTNVNSMVLSQHFAAAEIFDRAVYHGTHASGQSLSRAAHDEAISQADTVSAWIRQMPDPQRKAAELELNLIATQAKMSKYGWADARVRISAEHSHELLSGVDDKQQLASALWALATYHHVAGDRKDVRVLVNKMVEMVSRDNLPPLHRAAYTMQGIANWIDGHYREAAASLEQVLAAPVEDINRDAAQFGLDCRCWSVAGLANVRFFLDDDETQAMALARDAVAIAESINHKPSLGVALLYQAMIPVYTQNRPATAIVCERLLDLSRRYSLPAIEAYAAILDCWLREDADALSRILDVLQSMGCKLGLTFLKSLSADLSARKGDLQHAADVLDDCLRLGTSMGERYFEAELLLRKADLLLRQNTVDFETQILPILKLAAKRAEISGMEYTRRRAVSRLTALLAM